MDEVPEGVINMRKTLIAIFFLTAASGIISRASVWDTGIAAGNGWKWLSGIGFVYSENGSNWAYHLDFWEWMYSPSAKHDDIVFYGRPALNSDWFWSSSSIWPIVYSIRTNTWYQFTSDSHWELESDTGEWILIWPLPLVDEDISFVNELPGG